MSGALRGPDVSQWQGTVDWKAVAKWAAFGWTKATDGTGFVNPTFAENWNGMRSAGLTVRGAYHFAEPGDARAQGRFFAETVEHHGGFGPGTLAALDAEVPLRQGAVGFLADFSAGVRDVVDLPDSRIVVYSDAGWFDSTDLAAHLGEHPLWVAEYSGQLILPRGARTWAFWQHSQTAHQAGVHGESDSNVFNGSPSSLKKLAGYPSTLKKTIAKVGGGLLVGVGVGAGLHHGTTTTTTTCPAKVVAPVKVPPAAHPPLSVHGLGPFPLPAHEVFDQVVNNHGPDVVKIQQALKVKADGTYGPATAAAVAKFQRQLHLNADGDVYAATWRALP